MKISHTGTAFFTATFGQNFGPTKPPIQQTTFTVSAEVKLREVEGDFLRPSGV